MQGNLLGVELEDGRSIRYVVDAPARRIVRKVDGVATHRFLWQGDLRIAAEVDASGQVLTRYVYGTQINVPDLMIRDGATYRILHDHLGSARLVINTTTGEIVRRLDFDEWGNVTLDTNPGFHPFGFAGGLYDSDTGLVRFGARDYDATVGRWTAKDPTLFFGGDSQLYGYVLGNPLLSIDPTGEAQLCARPLDLPGGVVPYESRGRPGKASPLQEMRNQVPRHEHFWFKDERNYGFFGDSKVRPDEGHTFEDYDCFGREYDHDLLEKAIEVESKNPGEYSLWGNNCQHWAERVVRRYDELATFSDEITVIAPRP